MRKKGGVYSREAFSHTKVRTPQQIRTTCCAPQQQQLPTVVINDVGENVSTPSSKSITINNNDFSTLSQFSKAASKVKPTTH